MSSEISALTKDANAGDIEAQIQLADLYEQGFGVSLDHGQAAYWYRKAAEQGASKAQSRLGQMYLRGIGVPEDPEQAADWLSKSAEQGDATAEVNLLGEVERRERFFTQVCDLLNLEPPLDLDRKANRLASRDSRA